MTAQNPSAGESRARSLRAARRRKVIAIPAAAVVLAGGALAAEHFTAGGKASSRIVDGNTVEHTAVTSR